MSSDQVQTQPSPSAGVSTEVASNCTPEVIDEETEQEARGKEEEVVSLTATRQIEMNGYVSDEIGFRTPTSRGHRIPRSRSCPPAPRKLRPVSMVRKRKLTFDDHVRQEVEAFFDRSKRRSFSIRSSAATPSTTSSNNASGS